MSLASQFSLRLVGVTFAEHYPESLYQLMEQIKEDRLPVPLTLVREPENEFDPNAVAVVAPNEEFGPHIIGHIPRHLAARLAPEMDAGVKWGAVLTNVFYLDDHIDRPGADVLLTKRVLQREDRSA